MNKNFDFKPQLKRNLFIFLKKKFYKTKKN